MRCSTAPRLALVLGGLVLSLAPAAWAIDYKVEPLSEAPPSEVAAEIVKELSPKGVRVIRGSSTTQCDLWLKKELSVVAGFEPTAEILYPMKPGQLVGVIRYARKGADFRDQDIDPGVYTLRYAQQPVDGAHVGTSLTRDFLLLSKAEKDQSPAPLEYKPLTKQSAEAAGSSHPALLSMQRINMESSEYPAIRHDEEREWWVVGVQAQAKAGNEAAKPLPIEFVVVGVSAE